MGSLPRSSFLVYITDFFSIADLQLQITGSSIEIFSGTWCQKQQGIICFLRLISKGNPLLLFQHFFQFFCSFYPILFFLVKALGVYFFASCLLLCKRQSSLVFQKDYRLSVDVCGIFPVFLCSYHFHGFLWISVWVFKKSQLKFFFQSMGCCLCQSLIRKGYLLYGITFRHLMSLSGIITFFSSPVGFLCSLDIIGSADDIYSGVNSQGHSLADFQFFHAPGHILDDSGITVDIAFKAHLLLQKFLDKVIIKSKSYRLPLNRISLEVILVCTLLSGWLCIVRHDRSGVLLNSCLKRRDMISLQAVFGLVNIPLTLAVMRVKAVLSGASSREMLHSHSYSIRSQSLLASLYPRDQMLKNFSDQF